MKKERKSLLNQKQAVVLASFIALLLEILVTKAMTAVCPALDANSDASVINKVYMVFLAVSLAFFLRLTPITLNFGALKTDNRKRFAREMLEAAAISAVLVACMAVCRTILNTVDPIAAQRPVFGLYLSVNGRWIYPVAVIVQELLIKGLMQENFSSLSPNADRHFAPWITGIFFAALHINYPIYYILGAAALCIGTGYSYERDKNIWGSVLIHFVIGFMPRALGLK